MEKKNKQKTYLAGLQLQLRYFFTEKTLFYS